MDWRQCLKSYLDSLATSGESHTVIKDHTTRITHFMEGREDLAAVSREEIQAFCRQPSCHGKPSCETIKRRRDAIRALYDFAIEQGVYTGDNPARPAPKGKTPPVFDDPDWQAAYEQFLEEVEHKSGSQATVISYKAILRRFFRGKSPLSVTRTDVHQFVYALNNGSRNPGTQPQTATKNQKCAALRSFFTFCTTFTTTTGEALYEKANPCNGIKFGKPAIAYKSLSPEEIRAFFAAIDRSTIQGKRDYSLYMFFLMSARRRSAVQRLKFGDLEQTLIADEHGKTHQGWCYHFTEKGNSTVQDSEEIESVVVDLIMEYLEADGRLSTATPSMPIWTAIGPPQGGTVRPGEVRPLTSKSMATAMKKYAQAASLDPNRMSLHSWRHSSAKMRRLAGSSVLDISRVLRHSSLDMSMRYIGKLVSQSDDGGRLLSAQLAQLGVL